MRAADEAQALRVVRKHFRKFGGYTGLQLGLQGVQVVVSILVVRALSKPDYASYSVITATMAATLLVADSGILGKFMHLAGNRLGDPYYVGLILRTARRSIRRLGVLIALLAGSALFLVLRTLGENVEDAVGYAAVVLVTLWFMFSGATWQAYMRLTRRVGSMQLVQISVNIVRLFLIFCLCTLLGGGVWVLLAIGGLVALLESTVLSRLVARYVQVSGSTSVSVAAQFSAENRRVMPMNIALVAQGQILFAVLAFRGGPEVVANISALSRFAIVFVLLNALVTDLGSSYLSRLSPIRSTVGGAYLVVLGCFTGGSAAIVVATGMATGPLLWVLGHDYQHLAEPLMIVAAGTAAICLGDAMRVLNQARGWTRWSWVYIIVSVAWVCAGTLFFPLTDTVSASVWMALQSGPSLVAQTLCLVSGLRSLPRKERI